MNGTTLDPALTVLVPRWLDIGELGFMGPVICAVLCSSCFTLVIILLTPKLRNSLPGLLMVFLSVIDMFIISFDSAHSFMRVLGDVGVAPLRNLPSFFCQLQAFVNNYVYGLQSLVIMMLAVDRVVAIGHPLYYHCYTGRVCKRVFAALALVAGLYVLIYLALLNMAEKTQWVHSFSVCALHIGESRRSRGLIMIHNVAFYVIPGVIVVICYAWVYCKIKRRAGVYQRKVSQTTPADPSPPPPPLVQSPMGDATTSENPVLPTNRSDSLIHLSLRRHNDNREGFFRQLQLCKNLILITACYYIAFLPFFIYQTLFYFNILPAPNPPVYRVLKAIRCVNGVSDGLIFFLMSRTFQHEVRSLMERSFGRQRATELAEPSFWTTKTDTRSRKTSTKGHPMTLKSRPSQEIQLQGSSTV